MKKRLGALVTVGILLILVAWRASHPSANHRATPTKGPLLVLLAGSSVTTNQLTSSQLDGLPQWFSTTSSPESEGFMKLRMVQLTNTGKQPLELIGLNSASPDYQIYVNGPNGLERLSSKISDNRRLITFNLGPTQSMFFPIIPPKTESAWQVSVSYKGSVAPLTAMPIAPTRLESIVENIREFVPFLRKSGIQFYFAMSESVPGAGGRTQQSATQTNRSIPAAGSAR